VFTAPAVFARVQIARNRAPPKNFRAVVPYCCTLNVNTVMLKNFIF